ncbi:related to endonuclease/exonuclease/phosphatase family protein [Ustilago trichophora]|uniref:Related to endonuclease/exonuclease/phosphatase family protein n=1 Tax=Ustilago trichophora TaxID=86804 RepID=A0A5C3EBM7_9BASI|nr:related to endonuclease/exonuclease/phosphatase family protein [Ustilago trichophora]
MLGVPFLALASLLKLAYVVSAAPAATGSLTAVTMNVAGLPAFLNSNGDNDKKANSIAIGKKFAQYNYDLINVQEDFNYHAYIYNNDDHPYRTPTSGGVPFGSGLNTLSTIPIKDITRVKWDKCNLNEGDCLTPKGYTAVTLQLPSGGEIDVFNLHMDAGDDDGDSTARSSNFNQVAKAITDRSDPAGRAVIVMGDTNSRYTRPKDNLLSFLSQTKLTDTWVQLVRSGKAPASTDLALLCSSPIPTTTNCEVVDKVFYKSGKTVTLKPSDWQYLGKEFTDASGIPLADHTPISVKFTYTSS